uniref:Uncharacterized protein n=1 Tax=Oryza glumipatula TaxID=40148 RepID=A0A0E0A2C5_9ORYZ
MEMVEEEMAFTMKLTPEPPPSGLHPPGSPFEGQPTGESTDQKGRAATGSNDAGDGPRAATVAVGRFRAAAATEDWIRAAAVASGRNHVVAAAADLIRAAAVASGRIRVAIAVVSRNLVASTVAVRNRVAAVISNFHRHTNEKKTGRTRPNETSPTT